MWCDFYLEIWRYRTGRFAYESGFAPDYGAKPIRVVSKSRQRRSRIVRCEHSDPDIFVCAPNVVRFLFGNSWIFAPAGGLNLGNFIQICAGAADFAINALQIGCCIQVPRQHFCRDFTALPG